LCLIPPEVPRTDGSETHVAVERNAEDKCDLLWMEGREHGLETWVCHSHGERHWIGQASGRRAIPNSHAMLHFTALLQEAQNRDKRDEAGNIISHGLLEILFGIALRKLREERDRPVDSKNSTVGETPREWNPIQHAQDYIRQHLQDHLTIAQMARLTFMADSHFTARFRQETGQTFHQFLTDCRLQRAQEMLRDTDWQVANIAYGIGLDASRLRRIFSERFGLSPRQFRRQFHSRDSSEKKW
jgi:AraC-like DNA-binding protein